MTTNRTTTASNKGKRKAEPENTDRFDGEIPNKTGCPDLTIPDPELDDDDDDDVNDDFERRIDPRLLDLANPIAEVVADVDESAVITDEVQAIVLGQLGTPLDIPSALKLSDMEYLDLLSRINVIANQKLASSKSQGIPDAFRGNGRDEPQLFQYKCRKTPGCTYFTANTTYLKTHEGRCSAEKLEQIASADPAFPCPESGCPKSFTSATKLKSHQDNEHNYQPRACKMEGCDPQAGG